MKSKLYLAFIFLLLFAACSDDEADLALEQSVFIADPEYPGLPQYSEWGYNTFGAYYDREVFVSNDINIPLKVLVTTDTTIFVFKGQKGSTSYYSGNDEMMVRFIVPNLYPRKYTDLLVLNDSVLGIQDLDCKVEIYIDGDMVQATILDGYWDFNRVQRLVVDGEQVELILSGYFFFQAIINAEPISISHGRFDVGLGASNFYDLSVLE